MCEIFPEVDKCCMCVSIRVGMLFIAIYAIVTGSLLLCIVEKTSNASFANLKNISEIRQPKDVTKYYDSAVPVGLSFIAVMFMFTGLILLFGNLSDQEGLVQVFVWLTFLTVIIGFFMVIGIGLDCVRDGTKCVLSSFDWLSSAAFLVFMVCYLFVWIYFITVANTYVVQR